jgi:hypothetical protein
MSHAPAPAAARADTRQAPHPGPMGSRGAWAGWWTDLRERDLAAKGLLASGLLPRLRDA